jgi:hypothetical protein
MFGKEPEFYYKGRNKKTTLIGRIFTILFVAVYIAYFVYKLVKMIQREDVTFYDTYAFSGEIPYMNLSSDNFYGGFGIMDANGNTFVDETIYYARAFFYAGRKENGNWIWEEKEIGLERCKLEKFGKKYQDMFKDKDLNNMYCLENVDVTLEGYATSDAFSYFEVKLYPCNGIGRDGSPCMPNYVIDAYLNRNNFQFKMQDIELTPQDYKSPIQVREKDIAGPVYSTLYQQIYAYLQVTNIETDEDIIGFGLSNIKHEKYLKYDESWIISAPMADDIYTSGNALCVITVQLSEKALTQKRTYTTLMEVLGDVGGLMEFILMILNILLSFVVDNKYEKSLINNLFEFNLDKKVIVIKDKPKKNTIFSVNDGPNIYNPILSNIKSASNVLSNNNENTIATRNKFTEDLTSKNKLESRILLTSNNSVKKKRKKRKINQEINSTEKKMTEINNQIIIKKSTRISENINDINNNIYNNHNLDQGNGLNNTNSNKIENNRDTEREKDNPRIIKKIKLNPFCTYFCFLCIRKRKNIQNALLDEGMNIIVEQLDLLNLFRKLINEEKIKEAFSNHNVLEMSDTCKLKIP